MPADPFTVAQAIDTTASLITLAGKIVAALIKVVRFKKECIKLAGDVSLLSGILEKRKAVIESLEVTGPLNGCLSDCLDFVIQCQEWGLAAVATEVILRNRYASLKIRLEKWIEFTNFEANVKMLPFEIADGQ